MIKRLYVDNYKCLVDFTLEFENPLTLLLGRNGAGKTAVLDVVEALQLLFRENTQTPVHQVFPSRTLTRWHNRNHQSFEVEAHLDSMLFTYRLEVEHQQPSILIKSERLTAGENTIIENNGRQIKLTRPDGEIQSWDASGNRSALMDVHDEIRTQPFVSVFREFMQKIVVCDLQPARFEAASAQEAPYLARNAANFANWYHRLLLDRASGIDADALDADLREVLDGLDGFRRINLERDPQNDRRLLLFEFEDRGKRVKFSFDELSHGQRALVVLYGLLHLTKGMVSTILIDEPDNHLALCEIQPWLVKLQKACGVALPQGVLCSHHPELINFLGHSHGVLLSRFKGGPTSTRRLNDIPQGENELELAEIFARGWEPES